MSLNDRQDYFGQTVNVAARVQKQATSSAIFVTRPIVEHPGVAALLKAENVAPVAHERVLRGLAERHLLYEIP